MDDLFPRLVGVKTRYLGHDFVSNVGHVFSYVGSFVEYGYALEAVPRSGFKVAEVVRRGYLYRARAEFSVNRIVAYDGYAPFCQGKKNFLSYEAVVPFVFRVHGHGRVSEHGLRPCGGDGKELSFRERIAYVVEFPRGF